MRISKREYYLQIARAVAERSTCNRRHYGAVLVKNDRIIATGYNGSARSEPNCCDTGFCARKGAQHNTGYTSACPAIHAEQNAIISAGRDAAFSTLYIAGYDCETGEPITDAQPCEICKRFILNAGISRVITKAEDKQ